MIDSIAAEHIALKKQYDSGGSPLVELSTITISCLDLISDALSKLQYGRSDDKNYVVYTDATEKSRPVNRDLFIESGTTFAFLWRRFMGSIDPIQHSSSLDSASINKLLYTVITSFAICIDIWKPKSRKTPGTHFEVLLGSVISQFLPEHTRTKFIELPGQDEKVSTDIVFDLGGTGIVIPAKITTRERIVQPYAHQRILDSIFGEARYKSILLCVSETQRDDKKIWVNDICVPGTVKLFQTHLSKLGGLYYLDPPSRYLHSDISTLINVGEYGEFLKTKLASCVD